MTIIFLCFTTSWAKNVENDLWKSCFKWKFSNRNIIVKILLFIFTNKNTHRNTLTYWTTKTSNKKESVQEVELTIPWLIIFCLNKQASSYHHQTVNSGNKWPVWHPNFMQATKIFSQLTRLNQKLRAGMTANNYLRTPYVEFLYIYKT